MASLITKSAHNEVHSTLRVLEEEGATTDHLDWMRARGNAALLIRFINEQRGLSGKNPYELSGPKQLALLRRASVEEGWDIPEATFAVLRATVPEWPQGRYTYRSLRVRFGEGADGVALTFDRHCGRITREFGAYVFKQWEFLRSGFPRYAGQPVSCLRLLAGDHTHKPVVEWITVDLGVNRNRKSIESVRGAASLADELLVIVWMFPDMIHTLAMDGLLGMFAAGYEFDAPECDERPWNLVPRMHRSILRGGVTLDAGERGDTLAYYSVPVLL